MNNDRIKVAGYSQRVFFTDGIEYRNFSPDLVGLQLTSEGGTPLFTMGNFSVTTNVEPKRNKNFITTNFSNFITLTDLDLSLQNTQSLLTNNAGVILNLDKKNLTNYALFGSLSEFVRVSLENIITYWPAAMYVNKVFILEPDFITQTGYTIENYVYNNLTDETSFKVNLNVINNQYQINYLENGTLNNTFNQNNELRNLTSSYQSYAISYSGVEHDVLGFTGSTSVANDYLYFNVKGRAFSGAQTNDYFTYYIKPNKDNENMFFNSINDFEAYLLNRLVVPLYTSTFNFTIKSDSGDILYVNDSLTWPVTDGYNIDFDSEAYADYASKLLDISNNFDLTSSNLMVRFLVTESITDFDTTAVHLDPLDQDTSDQKMNKTLVIYGREYDDINNFISGIKFANTVSYDKNNNTPDIYLKNLARVLGWDLISSVIENDLLKSYIQPKDSTYSGQSVGLTPVEADIELWRRLILNTPWLWKSKGTRKSIEFLFKFIGTPLGLISFNEFIYLAENKIDMDIFQDVLKLNNLITPLNNASNYPVSVSGYPNPLPNTSLMYYQNDGLWYRETGGDNSSLDINTGNNPHVGPYDGGYRYINQFRKLIPNFSAVTISSQTVTTSTNNLFTNYKHGTMTAYSGNTYVDITTNDGVDFSNCYVVTSEIVQDPKHRQDTTNCGCDIPENLRSLSICIEKNNVSGYDCNSAIAAITVQQPDGFYNFDFYQYNQDKSLYTINSVPVTYSSMFVNKTCCNFNGSIPYHYNQFDNGQLVNSGFICCPPQAKCGCLVTCKWNLATPNTMQINNANYLFFVDELGSFKVVSKDGCNCIKDYSVAVPNITDPTTGEIGYGCQLTSAGLADIILQDSVIVKTYHDRSNGLIPCDGTSVITTCNLVLNVTTINSVGNSANGSATVNVTGGQPPYTYSWNTVPVQTTQTATNLVAGLYNVTVTDSTDCANASNVTVTNTNCNLTANITTSTVDANNVLLTAIPIGGTAPFQYLWNNNATTTTIIVTNSQLFGTNSVQITDANGCVATYSLIPVVQPPLTLYGYNVGFGSTISIACGNIGQGTPVVYTTDANFGSSEGLVDGNIYYNSNGSIYQGAPNFFYANDINCAYGTIDSNGVFHRLGRCLGCI